jgi:hypothetical protein
MTDIDIRLEHYYQSLLTDFASEQIPLPHPRAHHSLLPRVLAGAGLAAFMAVAVPLLAFNISKSELIRIHLQGVTITARPDSDVQPQMTPQQASAAALAYPDNPRISSGFVGYAVESTNFEPGVTSVVNQCGGTYYLPAATTAWVVELSLPPQQGWKFLHATVIVDDSGGATYGMILESRSAPVPGRSAAQASCQSG